MIWPFLGSVACVIFLCFLAQGFAESKKTKKKPGKPGEISIDQERMHWNDPE
jgi:hypothetical protein